MITTRITVAAAIAAGVGWAIWTGANAALGRSLPGQLLSVAAALILAGLLYAKTVLLMRIPEAHQIQALVLQRLRLR